MATPDIARIVSMIMENPKLIEEISNMAKADNTVQKDTDTAAEAKEEMAREAAAETAVSKEISRTPRTHHRSELLCALKPYVSNERAQAIDSMLSIVEILDLMKRR